MRNPTTGTRNNIGCTPFIAIILLMIGIAVFIYQFNLHGGH